MFVKPQKAVEYKLIKRICILRAYFATALILFHLIREIQN